MSRVEAAAELAQGAWCGWLCCIIERTHTCGGLEPSRSREMLRPARGQLLADAQMPMSKRQTLPTALAWSVGGEAAAARQHARDEARKLVLDAVEHARHAGRALGCV